MDYIFGIFILHNRPHITYKTLKDKMGLTWKVHAYGTSRRGSYTRCGVHYNKPYPGITYSIEYASTKEECTLDSKSCLDYKYNMNGCSQIIKELDLTVRQPRRESIMPYIQVKQRRRQKN